jgi:KaiC/GvpD/RAD55 family RecA-like ATPase
MKRNKKQKQKKTGGFPRPQKANDCIAAHAGRITAEPDMLFDEFWRDGELAIMFGASGTGKSILAVQIADALSRGRPIDGFRMPTRRHKVLYVDLDSSAKRFAARYLVPAAAPTAEALPYRFAENFYRDAPTSPAKLTDWLRNMIRLRGIRVVIVDSLASVRTATDGTKESLDLIRELRRITHETDVSILVVADAEPPSRGGIVTEADLRRSRVLCSAAESVFAIGVQQRIAGQRYIVQTRSKNSVVVWTANNAPCATIGRNETGLLSFAFDDRFQATLDDDTRELIDRIRTLRDEGKTFTEVAGLLEVSRSRVVRLAKKWKPAAVGSSSSNSNTGYNGDIESAREDDDEAILRAEEERYLTEVGITATAVTDTGRRGVRVSEIPFGAGMGRRSVYDLETVSDRYGNVAYIESRYEYDQQPMVWYQVNKKNIIVRFKRNSVGILATRLGPAPYLPRQ